MKSMKDHVMEKLAKYKVFSVIGAGGIGSWLLPQLCYWLAAHKFKGALHIWDGDNYEPKNAERQNFKMANTMQNKAEAKAEELKEDFQSFQIFAYNEYIGEENIKRLSIKDSIVFSCVDNHPLRTLLANSLEGVENTLIFSCGNELFDGNVHITVIKDGKTMTDPLLDRHPYIAKVTTGDRSKMGCADLIEAGQTQLLSVNASIAQMGMLALDHIMRYGTVQKDAGEGTQPYVFSQLVNDMYFDAVALKVVPVWSTRAGSELDAKALLKDFNEELELVAQEAAAKGAKEDVKEDKPKKEKKEKK